MSRKLQGNLFSFWISLLLALILPLLGINEYHLHILITIFLNILVASGLRLIMTTGLVSFCHASFMAIGGYTSALSVMRLGLSSWVGLVLGVFVTVLVSVVLGRIVLRLAGTYFFLATFAFGEVLMLAFSRWTDPFGGPAGLVFVPYPSPISFFGFFPISFGSKSSFYYFSLFLMLIPMMIVYRLDSGRMGKIWSSIRQSEDLARSLGINTMLYKIIAFVIGSSMAALAGAFQVHYYTNIHPGGFGFALLINYLIFVIVGGANKFSGPIIGVSLLTILSESLSISEALAFYQTIVYGLVLIFFVIFLPEGIVSLPNKIFRLWQHLRSKS